LTELFADGSIKTRQLIATFVSEKQSAETISASTWEFHIGSRKSVSSITAYLDFCVYRINVDNTQTKAILADGETITTPEIVDYGAGTTQNGEYLAIWKFPGVSFSIDDRIKIEIYIDITKE